MSEKKFTKAQLDAIGVRDKRVIVSAAAGSGKTTVLTERIIGMLLDPRCDLDITDMLIVTFTNDAVREMRSRISDALYSALAKDPANKRLSKQLMLLDSAQISTINSFCFSLVRSEFQKLGLPSKTSIADENEIGMMYSEVMSEVIELCYDGAIDVGVGDFGAFVTQLIGNKDERELVSSLCGLYKNLRNYPRYLEVLRARRDELKTDAPVFKTFYGAPVREYLLEMLGHYIRFYDFAIETMADLTFETKKGREHDKLLNAYVEEKEKMLELLSCVHSYDYSGAKKAFEKWKYGKLDGTEGDFPLRGLFESTRKKLSLSDGIIKHCASDYFSRDEEVIFEQNRRLARIIGGVEELISEFDKRLLAEKKRRGKLEFSDMEQFAFDLLYNSDLSLTDTAFALQKKYKAVFIDEYQDVNDIQDAVFGAIGKKDLFMVGDIKQCIYCFRNSSPELFAHYRDTFPKYDGDPAKKDAAIFLSDNFRSDRSVIDFANGLFKTLFSVCGGIVKYNDEDALVCGKPDGEKNNVPVRLEFFDVPTADGIKKDDRLLELSQKFKFSDAEPMFVAREIAQKIKDGVRPSEIAILVRTNGAAARYAKALKQVGLESYSKPRRNLLESDAVRLMLCLLNVIDNPSRDIYLAGALKSPLYGFTLDELTLIRTEDKGAYSLYDSLKSYAEKHDSPKCRAFFGSLERLRAYGEGRPVDQLIRYIYDTTFICDALSSDPETGEDRYSDLLLFYEYARDFEYGSFKGLYNFLAYVEEMIKRSVRPAASKSGSDGKNAVSVLTIHASKGLEFEHVYLCNMFGRPKNDSNDDFVVDREFGLATKLRSANGFVSYVTYPYKTAKLRKKDAEFDESIRLLYVAVTRAKKSLTVTFSGNKIKEKLKGLRQDGAFLSRYRLRNAKTLGEVLLLGLAARGEEGSETFEIRNTADLAEIFLSEETEGSLTQKPSAPEADDADKKNEYLELLKEKLSFEYPYKELTRLPSKLAVSKLYPSVLDDGVEDRADTVERDLLEKPRFLLPPKEKYSASEKGTATHLFMQFCDYASVQSIGARKEADRLVGEGYLPKDVADIVEFEKVEEFFESSFFGELRAARRVWREHRFNIRLPATDFTADPKKIAALDGESLFVQGVIDLLFEDKDGRMILCDYKTDRFSEPVKKSGEAERILRERHTPQLSYYRYAVKEMLKRDVDKCLIYSFDLGKTVEI